MSDAAINSAETPVVEAESDKLTPNDFYESIRELGLALPVNLQPTSHDAAAVVAGLSWYLATGSLEVPRVEVPDEVAERQALVDQTRENELLSRVAELERQATARDTPPSPVAPAPVAAVPEAAATGPAVPAEPAPTAPNEAGTTVGEVPPAVSPPVGEVEQS